MLALIGLGFRVAVPVVEAPGAAAGVPGLDAPAGRPSRAPSACRCRSAEPVEPDVLLVPMLAFDGRGHRLGYGGGFYDRTIAGLRARRAVTALGFAYAAQEVPDVPDSAADMRLDAVVTEQGVDSGRA